MRWIAMQSRAAGAAVVALLFFPMQPAHAEKPDTSLFGLRISGEDFLKTCRGTDASRSQCLGYVMGLSDGIAIFQNALAKGRASYANWNAICTPDTVSGHEIVAALVEFLEVNPESRQQPIVVLFTRALRKNWPCDR